MKKEIKCIYLIWRKGHDDRCIKVGVLKKNQTSATFAYLHDDMEKAKAKGFKMYPDFPDLNATYTKNVIEIFSQRLTNTERSDIQKYYDYWEIKPEWKDNKFYVLAQTQGLLPTDNFEFLAEYYPVKGLKFMSEICGLTRRQLPNDTLSVGDELNFKLEKENKFDKYAVQLFKDGLDVGYVKKVHSKVFHDSKRKNFKIRVKSLERNGHINRAFIAIFTEE